MSVEPMDPVVVGVDGSRLGIAAAELAADEAMSRATPLVVAHAYDDESASAAPDVLDNNVSAVRSIHPCLSVRSLAVRGQPARVLAELASSASLVVLGHRGHRGGRDTGSVAAAVLAHADVPVLVYRPTEHTGEVTLPRPVVVGVEAKAYEDAVVEFAFAEAWRRGAPLQAVHVWCEPEAGAVHAAGSFTQGQHQANEVLINALAMWSEKYPEVIVHRTLRHGLDAALPLAAASRSAQLVVVGSSARHPFPNSVAGAMVERAGCPVAVVPVR